MIQYTFYNDPMPAPRPKAYSRGNRAGVYNPSQYMEYKAMLASELRRKFSHKFNVPAKGTKERTKYIKNNRYALSVEFYRTKNVGDVDNYLKTVKDALEDAGILANDSQVDLAIVFKGIDKEWPRTVIMLQGLSELL